MLTQEQLVTLPYLFDFWAMPHQIAPSGDWRTWVILGGRGAGKTRAGAEWVRKMVEGALPHAPGAARRVALVGETMDQAREVMVFGDSGLMAICPPDRRPEWIAGRRMLVWPNGAEAQVFSAHDPDSLRGPQFDAVWADELAKWRKAGEAWDMLQFALRLGDSPRACVTTTPRKSQMLRELLEMDTTVSTHAPTQANRANLAASFLKEIEVRYGGTSLGRQEMEGLMLTEVEGALWTDADLARCQVAEAPLLDRIVVAIDPPGTSHAGSDQCGIVVAGISMKGDVRDWHAVVLEDASMSAARPTAWAEAAIAAMRRHGADRLVAEVNQGGDMVEAVLRGVDGTPIAGGTPADKAVVEAIADIKARGLDVVVSPVLMMEQLEGNSLPDPTTGDTGQPALPWVGEITTSLAPGIAGSPDGTAVADSEVAAFMGQAAVDDFTTSGTTVSYNGPSENSYRRFVLHYAHLCADAGGVSAFCIGTELAGLTRIRGAGGFPMVDALRALAADVRQILGAACKISYSADWTEYHGMQPVGTDDKIFHLDPLWADVNVDFIGVSATFPLADWRDGNDHLDMLAGAIHNLPYLQSQVAGGEYYDWHYPSSEARAAQRRIPITDPAGEPWIWRAKDFHGWWSHQHHDRIGGVMQTPATDWVPESKPIWLTSVGCAAVDKGANGACRVLCGQSALPYASNGSRDELIQMQYLLAISSHFAQSDNNPSSALYGGAMIDTNHMHVWGWDPRPYPYWPGNTTTWSDGGDYATGPWLNGRSTHRSLASVVAEICVRSGLTEYDVSELYGVVRGYTVGDVGTGRAALQPLMLAYGFDALERDGMLVFRSRDDRVQHTLTEADIARDPDADRSVALTRAAAAEIAGRVQFAHIAADGDYDAVAAEVVLPDDQTQTVTRSEAPVVMTRAEGKEVVARWLQEARIGRETVRFALSPALLDIGTGDTVALDTADHNGTYRIDRIEEAGLRLIEATRVEPEVYRRHAVAEEGVELQPYVGPIPAELLFLDLPLLTGDEQPHAPYVAAAGQPWPGSIALYDAPQDSDYSLQDVLTEPATVGLTETVLDAGPVGIWDRQSGLEVALVNGALSSALHEAILAGANTLAIGDGSGGNWEIIQFQNATPLAERSFRLSGLLRGQAGSRGLMPDEWPIGSHVVLLNAVPRQITIPTAARGTERHYRFGPASQAMSDASFRYETHAFAGNGLRPYPVAHARARSSGADIEVSWIRCSRIDGDIWADGDIPLGEDSERYRVRVLKNDAVVREEVVTTPSWTYAGSDLAADIGYGFYIIEIAQLSERYGAGLPIDILKFL